MKLKDYYNLIRDDFTESELMERVLRLRVEANGETDLNKLKKLANCSLNLDIEMRWEKERQKKLEKRPTPTKHLRWNTTPKEFKGEVRPMEIKLFFREVTGTEQEKMRDELFMYHDQ